MVRGDTAQLRVWDREPAGEVAPEHATVVEAVTGEGPGTRHSRERPFAADDAAGADEDSSG
jgi:hypothetical protein